MTAIHLRRHVAVALVPPTRGLGEQRRRPPIWRCSGWRLPRFTRFRLSGSDSSLWPCSSLWPTARAAGVWRPSVTRHPALWSPDFPLSPISGIAAVWLASDAEHNTSLRTPSGGNVRAPSQRVAGGERHDAVGAQRALRRHLPVLPSQRDRVGIARQPVEIGALEAREALEPAERAGGVEHFRIELERRGRRIAAGASAGALFRVSRMGRAVGAEEELRIA